MAKTVTKTQEAPTPAAMAQYEEDSGLGVSAAPEDNLIPMAKILQTLSPQLNKKKAEYVEEAEVGDILLKGHEPSVIKGDKGFEFVPCYFTKDYVEWIPRDSGGGLVARHKAQPKEAKEIKDKQNPNRRTVVMPNGNEIIETRYHIGYVIDEDGSLSPYVLPFKSTGHAVSREWMFSMNSKRLPSGATAPSFAFSYRLKTKERSNAAGDWLVFAVSSGRSIPKESTIYQSAKSLHLAFAAGAKDIERDDEAPAQSEIPF